MNTRALLLTLALAFAGNASASILYYNSGTGTSGGGSAGATSSVYAISTATGVDTLKITLNGVFYTDLASSPVPGSIYAIDDATNDGCLHTFNVITLADTLVGCAGTLMTQIGYDEPSDILYGTNTSNLYTINQNTGAATLIGSFGGP